MLIYVHKYISLVLILTELGYVLQMKCNLVLQCLFILEYYDRKCKIYQFILWRKHVIGNIFDY